MKRLFPLVCLLVLGVVGTTQAQSLEDYVEEERGDTLVIRDYYAMDAQPNSLVEAIRLDEDPPEGRVYFLPAGTNDEPAFYPLIEQYVLPERPITIVGEYVGQIAQGDDPDRRPPMITGFQSGDAGANSDLLQANDDLTYKNLAILPADNDAEQGWTHTTVLGEGTTVTFDNVLGEHNNWTWVQSNAGVDASIKIYDSYFINANGQPTRRNGGVYDSENNPLDTMWVENTTHVNNAGMQYKFRNHPARKAVFNHNTFVNVSGQLFTTFGYQRDFTVTNNLIVNSNVQAHWTGLDANETGTEEPHGIININHFPEGYADSIGVADEERMVLVDLNGVYWSDEMDDIIETIQSRGWDGSICPGTCAEEGEWSTQMITANTLTQQILDNDERYPLITEGDWIQEGDPGFAIAPEDVDDEIMDAYIEWNVDAVDDENATLLPDLRRDVAAETGLDFLMFDWPVAVDLSYTNEAYLDAGLGGYPLGDLNWFPADYEAWQGEREDLYDQIQTALETGEALGTAIEEVGGSLPGTINLEQNYPNPFSTDRATQIAFSLPRAAHAVIEVYDVTGRRVATLVDRQFAAGNYTVDWNGADQNGRTLSSGVYFYSLQTGDRVETKQMVFVK